MYDISGWSHRLLWGASVDISRDRAPAGGQRAGGGRRADRRRLRATRPGPARHPARRQGRPGRQRAARRRASRCAAGRTAPSWSRPRRAARPESSPTGSAYGSPPRPAAATAGTLRRPVLAAAVAADELFALRGDGLRGTPGLHGPAQRRLRPVRRGRAGGLLRPVVRRAQPGRPGPRSTSCWPAAAWSPGARPARPSTPQAGLLAATRGRRPRRRQRRGVGDERRPGRSARARCRTRSSTRRCGSPTSARA